MPRQPREFVTLDGCEVIDSSEDAVRVAHTASDNEDIATWIPRIHCEAGHDLVVGDEDISVAKWLADREGLPY